MQLTLRTRRIGGPDFIGTGLVDLISTVLACRRWAYAMQGRYERLGANGFRRDARAFDVLMEEIDPGARGRRPAPLR